MSQLTEALNAQLDAQGGKGLSDVTGQFVEDVHWILDGTDMVVTWTYNNTGDYDKNSEVNVADLVPISINFLINDSDLQWPFAMVADGDGNGEVNIADVTPIGVNFGSVVSNYVVEADIDGGGNWQPVANVPFSEGIEAIGSGLLHFDATIPNGYVATAFRSYAGPEAVPLYELEDLGWVATVNLNPLTGYAPMEIIGSIFFAGDNGPYDIEIDFDDGSAIYHDNSPTGAHIDFAHTFTDIGTYDVRIVVTNTGPLGGSLIRIIQVSVVPFDYTDVLDPGNWVTYILQSGAQWGDSAVALIDDRPAIVYTNEDDDEIYYARAIVQVPTQPAQWQHMLVDDGANRGGGLDLAAIQGKVCVVYEDTTGQDTYFANSADLWPLMGQPWTIHEVDSGESLRIMPQIEEVAGMPALAYKYGGGVRYAVSNLGPGLMPSDSANWTYSNVDASGPSAFNPQLAVANNTPIIAYSYAGELRYAWWDTTDWHIAVADADILSANTNKVRLMLAGSDPDPVVLLGYQTDFITRILSYARCPVWNPGTGAEFTRMDVRQEDQVHVGDMLGMTFFHLRPFFSYLNSATDIPTGLNISYANTDTPSGPEDFEHAVIDSPEGYYINQQTSCMNLVDGSIFIVYRTSEALKYAYFAGPSS